MKTNVYSAMNLYKEIANADHAFYLPCLNLGNDFAGMAELTKPEKSIKTVRLRY